MRNLFPSICVILGILCFANCAYPRMSPQCRQTVLKDNVRKEMDCSNVYSLESSDSPVTDRHNFRLPTQLRLRGRGMLSGLKDSDNQKYGGANVNPLESLPSRMPSDRRYYESLPNFIHDTESRDTTVKLKKDTIIDFDWILRKLYKIQRAGRESLSEKMDMYDCKLHLEQWTKERNKCYNKLVINQKHDTIFFEETIINLYKFTYTFWKDLKKTSLFYLEPKSLKEGDEYIFPSPLYCSRIDYSGSPYHDLIMTWQKDSLLQNWEGFYSDVSDPEPASTCISRVIVTPDSVSIDMIKYPFRSHIFHRTWFID